MNTKTRPDIRHKVLKKHLPKRGRYGPTDSRIDGPTDRRTDERTDPLTELVYFMRLFCRRKGLAFRGNFCSVPRDFSRSVPSHCECRVLGVQIDTGAEFLRDRVDFFSFLRKKCYKMILSSLCPSSDAHWLQNGNVTLLLSHLLSTYVKSKGGA